MEKLLPRAYREGQKGFTLVELMVVIVIIAILATTGFAIFTGIQKSARDSRRKADVDAISKALEVHNNQSVNQYCAGAIGTYCAPVATWFAGGTVPTDPSSGAAYAGLPANGAATYTVTATLEGGGTYSRSNQQ